jgi:hypothetical protein
VIRTLALLLFVGAGLAARADSNELTNGSFADGLNGWEGDVHVAGGSSDDSNSTKGVVVRLRSGDWSKISQDFNVGPGTYTLTVTYVITPNTTFSKRPEDYLNVPRLLNMGGMVFNVHPGQWAAVFGDPGASEFTFCPLAPAVASGNQTVVAEMTFASSSDHRKGFTLGFPPGTGTINLLSITLIPSADAPSASAGMQ